MDRASGRRPQIRSGKISLDAIREVAQELERANWIGTLHVSAGDSEKYCYFSVGGVRLVSSGSRKYTSLGRLLVRRGVVAQHDLSKALQSQSQTKARLGDILIKWRLATKDDLEHLVQVQVENEIIDIVTWDDGEFRFHRGMPGDLFERSARATTVSLNIESLIERLVGAAEKWGKIRAKIPHFNIVYRLTNLGRQEAESADVAPARRDFLQLVDGQRQLRTVAQQGEFGRFELAEIAFDALQGGLLQPVAGMGRATGTDASEIAKLEQALQAALNDVLIRRKLAEAYERSGDMNKAVENYRHLAEDASRSYQDEDAISALERVTRLVPTEFGAHEQLLDAYMRTGRKQRSVEQGSRMGDLYRKHRLFNRAKQVLMKVIGLAPRNVKIRTLLGDTYADLGDAPAAVQEWEQAIGVLREEKSEPVQLKQYAEKILGFDAGNRVARRVLAKIGETAAPLAPAARVALLLATAGLVAFGVWWERSAALRYNAIAAGATGALQRGQFGQVLSEIEALRSARPISLITPALLRHERALEREQERLAERHVTLALADADAALADNDAAAALGVLQAAEQRAAGRILPEALRRQLTRRLGEVQAMVQERSRQAGRIIDELQQTARADQAVLRLAQEYGAAVERDPRMAGQRPLRIPLQTVPTGAQVADGDGRTLGLSRRDPEQTVFVPMPLGGRLRARVLLPGFEPLVVDVPWTEVAWPHVVELHRALAWSHRLGTPSGPAAVAADGSGVWVGSTDRHLYWADLRGGAPRAIGLGLDGEAIGAPLAVGDLALVATRAGDLRGFVADGSERVRVRLPGMPGAGPVAVGSWIAQILEDGTCWVWPLAALRTAGLDVTAATVDGVLPPIVFGQAPVGTPRAFRDDWLLILGTEGRFASYELPAGRERFRKELGGRPTGPPALSSDGTAYIALGDGRVEARHVGTGDMAWRQPASVPGGAASPPAVAPQTVVVGSATDGALAFDRDHGGVIGEYPTGCAVSARPLVVGDALYIADRAGWLWQFGLKPGAGRRWRRPLDAPVSADMRHVEGAVLVVTEVGRLAAVRE